MVRLPAAKRRFYRRTSFKRELTGHNSAMHFEHLVAINEPGIALAAVLSREQVWSGLMQRVEDARPFLPGLDHCHILVRGAAHVERRLHFGSAQVHDRALFAASDWVRFETPATALHGGGVLTIHIEEPGPGWLVLRFIYETEHAIGAEAEDAAYEDYLRQAYEAADVDTVRVIRELAAGLPVATATRS
jgi:hypothetical protein